MRKRGAIREVGYLLKKIKKTLIGLSILRGSPCKVESVVANYESTVDPTYVTSHTVTLRYLGNPGLAATLDMPISWETKSFKVNNGRNIAAVTYNSRDTDYFYYDVTFTDNETVEMKIPRVIESTRMIVVQKLPEVLTARDDAFYLLQEDMTKDVYVKYVKVLSEDGSHYEWLNLGSTLMDLDGYQKKIDDDIIKNYKNYDVATKDAKPTAKNVVGAINTFEKEIGANYSDATGKITNLKTLHKDTLVDAINEIGLLPKLLFYDTSTGKPDNLVDAINMANKDYKMVLNQTIDRTKYVNTYKLELDAKDGSAKVQVGDTALVPRVDVQAKSTADNKDYRTYEVKMAGETKDPKDTTNKLYGTIHIPKIQIKKIEPVTLPSLAAEYYLSIEDGPYSAAISGTKIQIQKDLILKDAGVKECTVAGKPLETLAVGEKFLYLLFLKSDGTSVFAYVACKDLITESVGLKAIKIEYDSARKVNVVKLIIHDPDANKALVQTSDGLRIMNATITQYGVVEYSSDEEILSPAVSTFKATKPIDLYNFATKSLSVINDLGNIYMDANGKKPNDTITKAISLLATTTIEERSESVVKKENITEYQLLTLPVAGVKRQLGSAIDIPKSILDVESLLNIEAPKEYFLYYLTKDEPPYDPGLYKRVGSAWVKTGQDAIVLVELLPKINIKLNCFYELANHDIVTGRYSLTEEAKKKGYSVDEDGIHFETTDSSWGAIKLDWSGWINDEILSDVNGLIFMVKHSDGTEELIWNYKQMTNALYYHYENEWIEVSPVFRKKYMDADENFITNIDADELKPQKPKDKGKGFVINEYGEWLIGEVGGKAIIYITADEGLPNAKDPDNWLKFYLVSPAKMPETNYTRYKLKNCFLETVDGVGGIHVAMGASSSNDFKQWNIVFGDEPDPMWGNLKDTFLILVADDEECDVYCYQDADGNWHGVTEKMASQEEELYYSNKTKWIKVGGDVLVYLDFVEDLPEPEDGLDKLYIVPNEMSQITTIRTLYPLDVVRYDGLETPTAYYYWDDVFADDADEDYVNAFNSRVTLGSALGRYMLYEVYGHRYAMKTSKFYERKNTPTIYYSYMGAWHRVGYEITDRQIDARKNIIMNIGPEEMMNMRKDDEGSTYIVDEDGDWTVGHYTQRRVNRATVKFFKQNVYNLTDDYAHLYLLDFDKDDEQWPLLIQKYKDDGIKDIPLNENEMIKIHTFGMENGKHFLEYIRMSDLTVGKLVLETGVVNYHYVDMEPTTAADILALDMFDTDNTFPGWEEPVWKKINEMKVNLGGIEVWQQIT